MQFFHRIVFMSLFRAEVYQAKQNRWTGRIVLTRPFSFTFLTICAALLALALVLFTIFGSYTDKTSVEGQLLPRLGVARVYPPEAGIITAVHVADGDMVNAGDALFTLSTSRYDGSGNVQARLAAEAELKKTLAEQEIQRQQRIHENERQALQGSLARLQEQRKHVKQKIAAQAQRVTLAEQIVAKQRRLVREKAVSEVEKMRSEEALLELRTDLETFKREEAALARDIGEQQSTLANLPARQQTEISQLERAAAAYKQEVLDYSLRGEQTIRAAASGRVNALNAEAGQQVDPARLLLSIVPQDAELVVQLYVPSRAIGFIAPEDRVILRYQAYPYQKFGHAEGRILSIAETALGKQELSGLGVVFSNPALLNEPAYLVRVKPDKASINVYGKEKPLHIGMVVEADILHERKRLYEWILEPLYGIADKWQ